MDGLLRMGVLKILVLVLATAVVVPAAWADEKAATSGPAETVQRLARAFNAHDADRMAELVTSDFVLFYVDDEAAQVGARGPEDLRTQMRGYFRQFPDVQSVLSDVSVNGTFVTCTERAKWKRNGEWRSQASTAVFDVRDGRLRRAWYFAAQP